MILVELLNAISMIAPFISWMKHRRNKNSSKLHKYIPTQLIISSIYHTCSAIFNRPTLIRSLRALDIFSIHICSLMCCLDGLNATRQKCIRRPARILCLYSSIPFLAHDLIFNVVIKNKVIFVHRFALILQNNIQYLYLIPLKDNMVLITSGGTCAYFYNHTSRGLSHTYFHLSLYTLFDEYWKNHAKYILNQQNLRTENKKSLYTKNNGEIQITVHSS